VAPPVFQAAWAEPETEKLARKPYGSNPKGRDPPLSHQASKAAGPGRVQGGPLSVPAPIAVKRCEVGREIWVPGAGRPARKRFEGGCRPGPGQGRSQLALTFLNGRSQRAFNRSKGKSKRQKITSNWAINVRFLFPRTYRALFVKRMLMTSNPAPYTEKPGLARGLAPGGP